MADRSIERGLRASRIGHPVTEPAAPPIPPAELPVRKAPKEPKRPGRGRRLIAGGVTALTLGGLVGGGYTLTHRGSEGPSHKPTPSSGPQTPGETPTIHPTTGEIVPPTQIEQQRQELFNNIQEINNLGRVGLDRLLNQHPIERVGVGDVWNIEYKSKDGKIVPLTLYNSQQTPKIEAKPFLFSNAVDARGPGGLVTSGLLVGIETVPVENTGGVATIGDAYLEIPQSSEFAHAKYQAVVARVDLTLSGNINELLSQLPFDPIDKQHPIRVMPPGSNGHYIMSELGGYTWVDDSKEPGKYTDYLKANIGHVVRLDINNGIGGGKKTPADYQSLFDNSWLLEASIALYNGDVNKYDAIVKRAIDSHQAIPTTISNISELPDLSGGVATTNDLPHFGILGIIQGSKNLIPHKK